MCVFSEFAQVPYLITGIKDPIMKWPDLETAETEFQSHFSTPQFPCFHLREVSTDGYLVGIQYPEYFSDFLWLERKEINSLVSAFLQTSPAVTFLWLFR